MCNFLRKVVIRSAVKMEQDLRTVLNVKISSPYWEDAYKRALQEPLWFMEPLFMSGNLRSGDCGLNG